MRLFAIRSLSALVFLAATAGCEGGGARKPVVHGPARGVDRDGQVQDVRVPAGHSIERVPFGDALIENRGQLRNHDIRLYSRGHLAAGFAPSAILIRASERRRAADVLRGVLLRIAFQGARPVEPEGVELLPHATNYFLGSDPSRWFARLRSYGAIVYPDLYDGIALRSHVTARGVKYEFRLAPGADPTRIHVVYEGANTLRVDSDGTLVVETALGEIRESAPIAVQDDGSAVACRFTLRGARAYGFACEGRDSSRAMTIDPLIYATFVGGSEFDTETGNIHGLEAAGAGGRLFGRASPVWPRAQARAPVRRRSRAAPRPSRATRRGAEPR
jgi:hypothetical protein